ncbi:MAG: DNA-3-methyladenine glycosylase, partial [Anaerolineales bacterium]|nr:DNA-3-methyladenine glycosylase [Anaerolineales bacterium]
YVYFNYGMHWLLNFVTEERDYPAAVLIRAIQPLEGLLTIEKRREGQPPDRWTDGPAKLCQALGVDQDLNGIDICSSNAVLFVEWGVPIPDSGVTIGPRVGLNKVAEPWKSILWRFKLKQDA